MNELEYGYNIPALRGMSFEQIQTPCLIIDYENFKKNIEKMKIFSKKHNVKLRPHAKMHKSVDISLYQLLHGGASGICCQKVSEAEVFVRGGVKDILITNQVCDYRKIDKLCKLNLSSSTISCCVDNIENVKNINKIAYMNSVEINLLIELECGAKRCGVEDPNEIAKIFEFIQNSPNLNFIGFQAYNGSNQHIVDFYERKKSVEATNKKILDLVKDFNLDNIVVTGGGTGCFEYEVVSKIYDEIQVGSYAFMDAHYSSLRKELNSEAIFDNALFLLTSVISNSQNSFCVVDAGLKSMTIDSGLPKVFNNNKVKYIKCSDEHGILEDKDNLMRVNQKLLLVPGHCDPTCNLHDWYVVVDKNRKVKDLWEVSARGFSF